MLYSRYAQSQALLGGATASNKNKKFTFTNSYIYFEVSQFSTLKGIFSNTSSYSCQISGCLTRQTESESETENEANEPGVGGGNIGSTNGLPQDQNNESSVLGGANVGNTPGVGVGISGASNDAFFSDDDSGESSRGDDDESEAGETDEQDGDEFSFVSNAAGTVGGPGGVG